MELLQNQAFDLNRYNAIATISGDGGLHEVVNGLYGRLEQKNETDFKSLLDSISLALIPAGSSNGLATSLGFRDSFDAVRCLLEKKPRPLDLLRVTITPKDPSEPCKTFWDPHTVSWAIGSEHDELQELQLRWLPTELRNLVAPLIVIFQAKRHKGKIDFMPVELDPDTRSRGHFSDETMLSPSACFYFDCYCEVISKMDYAGTVLPGGKCIDDHFIMTAILNSPAGASDMLMSTTLAPDDGSIEIMIIRNASSFNLLKVFIAFEDASYLTNKLVEHYKVTELCIDPAAPVGQFFISGEKASIYGRVHIKNFHRFANFVW